MTMMMKLIKILLATLAIALAPTLHAQSNTLRIGYQKSASLFVLQKASGSLE